MDVAPEGLLHDMQYATLVHVHAVDCLLSGQIDCGGAGVACKAHTRIDACQGKQLLHRDRRFTVPRLPVS